MLEQFPEAESFGGLLGAQSNPTWSTLQNNRMVKQQRKKADVS